MKKKLLILVLLLTGVITSFSATPPLVGTLKNPDGTSVNGYLSVRISKPGVIDTCNSGQLMPYQYVKYSITNGALQGSPTFTPTDCTSPTEPYYVEVHDTSTPGVDNRLYADNWYLPSTVDASIDIGTLKSAYFVGPVVVAIPKAIISTPTGTQTITQPGGTSLVVNGNLIVASCTGCTNSSSSQIVGWNASGNLAPTFDTGLSRGALGQVFVGNGTFGDASGLIQASQLIQSNDASRIASIGTEIASNKVLGFSSTTSSGGSIDVAFSRDGIATIDLGNGTAGDITGKMYLQNAYTGTLLTVGGGATLNNQGFTSGFLIQDPNLPANTLAHFEMLGGSNLGEGLEIGITSKYSNLGNSQINNTFLTLSSTRTNLTSAIFGTAVVSDFGGLFTTNLGGGFQGGYATRLGVFSAGSFASSTFPAVVKIDGTNADSVVMATTADTGAGIAIGVCTAPGNSFATPGTSCDVLTTGAVKLTLGTGTCALAQYVIVDTTTNGRVKCTSTFTAGTVIGTVLSAQSTVGQQFDVLVGLR